MLVRSVEDSKVKTQEVPTARRVRREAARQVERAAAKGPKPSASASAAAKALPSPWILGRWLDLLLFVGTPALLIPLFSSLQSRWSAQTIFLYVGAFGAMGHHLPGMIRAYGDRALFERFRARFLIAPVAIVVVCVWSAIYDIQAVQLVALAWGIWHGMMQTYGFCRIYDSKSSAKAAARARIDWALCFVWFIGAVILSPLRFRSCLELYYDSGGPIIPRVAFELFRASVATSLALVTIAFFWRQLSDWRAGRGASPVKLALLASSIGFWWYCNNGVQNILVGIALFEVFHDVQYLSIVWIYNRSRVERDESIKGFMRFVFRRSGSLLGVYVGLVLAYGSIALLTSQASADWIRQALVGVVTASALLHFYYDGFIWKVRETQTRSMLNISGDGADSSLLARRWLPSWSAHAVRWAALLIPFGLLCASQLLGRIVPPMERTAKVAEVLPHDARAQLKYGKVLHESGQVAEAKKRYVAAIALDPKLAEAEKFLGLAFGDSNDLDEAAAHYRRALELDATDAKTECNLGGVLAAQGLRGEARRRFEHSLSLDPTLFLAHKELGDLLVATRDYDGATAHYAEAIRINPDFVEAKQRLERLEARRGR